jgi:hypothetical protein
VTVRFGFLLLVFATIVSGRANAAAASVNVVFDGDSISKGAGATLAMVWMQVSLPHSAIV